MEILATNVDSSATVFAILCVIVAAIITAITVVVKRLGPLIYVVFFIFLASILYFGVGTVTTYDALITDYNEVYEQGYEVITSKGKLVTLRKVGE